MCLFSSHMLPVCITFLNVSLLDPAVLEIDDYSAVKVLQHTAAHLL